MNCKKLITIFAVMLSIGLISGGLSASSTPLEADLMSLSSQNFPFIYLDIAVSGIEKTTLGDSNFDVYENGSLQEDYFRVIPPKEGGGVKLVDVVFLMDNSGSMDDEQRAVEDNVMDFVNDLSAGGFDFALGLCRFGAEDNDGKPIIEDGGSLTTDPVYFKNELWGRNIVDGGFEPGWDALYESATDFNFRPGALKVFVLITDETPTDDDNVGNYSKNEAISILQDNSITNFSLVELSDSHAEEDYCSIADASNGECFEVTKPFGDIFNYISTNVTDTYRIRYKSSHPSADKTTRKVETRVSYQGKQETVSGSYVPGGAPVIERTQDTKALHDKNWAAGTEFTIKARIADDMTPSVQEATVHYRKTGDTDYSSVSMSANSGNIYKATIPGDVVEHPGLEYYITATDGKSTTSNPSTNERAKPHNLAILPNKKPQIDHTPVAVETAGSPVEISMEVSDNTNSLQEVKLYYRKTGDPNYQETGMSTAGGNISLKIPKDYVVEGGTEYYIYAEDDLGVYSTSGSRDNPHTINFVEADGEREKWAIILPGDDETSRKINKHKMNAVFHNWWGMPDSHVKVEETALNGGDLSQSDVKDLIEKIGRKADGDDILIFYYCGHGSSNALTPNGTYIAHSTLGDWFESYWRTGNREEIVIIDSCHSGAIIEEIGGKSERWVQTSCGADETSIRYDIPVIGGNIFTHFLADAYMHGTYPELTDLGIDITDLLEKIDTDGDGMISLREGFDYASTNTKRTFDHLFGAQGTPQMDPETEDFTVPQKEPGFFEGVLIFFARSPVDMVVSDPEGRTLSKTTNEVGGSAFCVEGDFDEDNDAEEQCTVFNPVEGTYSIDLSPEPDASSTDTFTLEVASSDGMETLAEEIEVEDIPEQGYEYEALAHGARKDERNDLIRGCTGEPVSQNLVNKAGFIDIVEASASYDSKTNYLTLRLKTAESIPKQTSKPVSYSLLLDLDGNKETDFLGDRSSLDIFPELGIDLWLNYSHYQEEEDNLGFSESFGLPNLNSEPNLMWINYKFRENRRVLEFTVPMGLVETPLEYAYLPTDPGWEIKPDEMKWVAFTNWAHSSKEDPIADFLPLNYYSKSKAGCLPLVEIIEEEKEEVFK